MSDQIPVTVLLSLVDSLRCPADHEESPLVLSADAWRGTRISAGVLGCPICHARYAIRDGTVDFTSGAPNRESSTPDEFVGFDPIRLAAQLDLREPGGIILLTGRYAVRVEAIAALVDAVYVLVDSGGAVAGTAVNVVLNDRIPVTDGALRAAAIDTSRRTPEFLTEVMRSVRSGGRVVAPANAVLTKGLRLLARDEVECVAEVEPTGPVVQLRRSAHGSGPSMAKDA